MNRLSEILAINPVEGRIDIPLMLAPMAGITDWAMRVLSEAHGCNAATTEMISAQGFLSARKTRTAYQKLIARAPYEKPLGVQIFGHDPLYMGEAAHVLSSMQRYAFIDINMGCPARKVTSGGSGSALMRDERLAGRIIASVVKGSMLPVSVKMRLGWDDEHINAVQLAEIAEHEGASFVTVHGRTAQQQYSGCADWNRIAEVKDRISIPVIANGDITNGKCALKVLTITGADGLAIARAALGNPWVFSDIRASLNGECAAQPTAEDRLHQAQKHADYLRASLPEHRAILEMRKFYAWYIKGLRGAAEARTKINTAKTFDEIHLILQELLTANQ